jgi:hypothetical protein
LLGSSRSTGSLASSKGSKLEKETSKVVSAEYTVCLTPLNPNLPILEQQKTKRNPLSLKLANHISQLSLKQISQDFLGVSEQTSSMMKAAKALCYSL